MRLFYFRHRIPNFGDDLNADLWPALLPDLFGEEGDEGFVGIGTIIGRPVGSLRRLHVFSSGVGNDPPEGWRALEVRHWCVRGPLSARILGLPDEAALTDGAILSPLVPAFPSGRRDGGRTLVIPHWQTLEHPGWAEACRLAEFDLVDPRGTPEEVIGRIASARLVLTESLHGAILADTYGVPWHAFAASGNFNIPKFSDWTESLGMRLRLTSVPPPAADTVLAFGRPPAGWGETREHGLDEALALMRGRFEPRRPGLVDRAKAAAKATPLARMLLRLSPERTAAALAALAGRTPSLSEAATREALRERMLDRLDRLAREKGATPRFSRGNATTVR